MARKLFVTIVLGLLSSWSFLFAQTNREKFEARRQENLNAFNQRREDNRKNFIEIREKQHAVFSAYADSMHQKWEEYRANVRLSMPVRPEPKVQPVRPSNVSNEDYVLLVKDEMGTVESINRKPGGNLNEDIPEDLFDELLALLEGDDEEIPEEISSAPATLVAKENSSGTLEFAYRNTPCRVRMGQDFNFNLPCTDEKCCSDAWLRLSEANVDLLFQDCAALKKAMHLNDWGYLDMLHTMGQAFYRNEDKCTLFQFMMMVISDYRVKICRMNDHLFLMANMGETVYGYNYLDNDGPKYYVLTKDEVDRCYVMKMPREGKKSISLVHSEIPTFTYDAAPTKVMKLEGEEDESLTLKVRPNKNLIEYYDNYPLTDKWNYYVATSLSRNVKDELYPFLKKQMEGKSEKGAVNFLLSFVQHSFQYKTDGEQFGYERPFFADETFYFPYNDCEDRAILFSILVGDLLGLQSILLEYGDHLTTAVRFNEPVGGSAFNLADGKYTCCDPTYIGAGVGESMPQYREKEARVIRL